MREFWAFVFICATLFAALATAMLVVMLTGHDRELAAITTAMAAGGWFLAYWAFKYLMALPKKKEDIW